MNRRTSAVRRAAGSDALLGRVRATLRMHPADVAHVARRKLGPPARAVVRPAMRVLAPYVGRAVRSRSAEVTYFAVLDGHTLSVQVVLPSSAAAYTSTDIEFRHGSVCRTVRATLRSDDPTAPVTADATILLGDAAGRFPLASGVWRLRLRTTTAGGEPIRLRMRRSAPVAPDTGPTMLGPLCPDTGVRYRAASNALGFCFVAVTGARPRAEISHVTHNHSGALVQGRFVGVADVLGARFAFNARGSDDLVWADGAVDDGRFSVAVPLDRMMPPAGDQAIWDMRVHVPGHRPLRVGRYLHDLRNVRGVYRGLDRLIALPGDQAVFLRHYYTPAGSLALACRSAEREAN